MSRTLSRRAFLLSSAAFAAAAVSGCSLVSAPPITFDLMGVQPADRLSRRTNRTILILEPTAIDTYNSQRIVVRDQGIILAYLPEAQWSDTLPALLRTRMQQSFEDRGVPNIARSGDRVNVEIALATDIRAFELDTREGAQAVVTISARLVDEVARRVLATRVFTTRVPVASTDSGTVVASLDAAMRDVINQIMVWTTTTV